MNNSPSSPLECPLLSFFTGAGFLDIGFLQNGFQTVWHNEVHKPFVQGFEFGMSALGYTGAAAKVQNTNSIINVGPNEIIKEAFKGGRPPALFGVIGGPPCPDFSVGGKNKGQQGDHGRLSEVYVRRIIELNPAFFVFENVPGLLRTKKHRLFLASLIEQLKHRFALDIKVLNALDFGVPQDRERVFLVGFNWSWLHGKYPPKTLSKIRKASSFLLKLDELSPKEFFVEMKHWFPWPIDPNFAHAKLRFDWPKDTSPFGAEPKRPMCPKELMVGTYICNQDLSCLANSDEAFTPKSKKFREICEGDVSRKSFKRLHRYRYSPAAAYGNNEVHLHPCLPRRLTVREAMMIQTVPMDYALPQDMTLSNKFKTIGNGVPVKLSSALAKSIANFIKEASHEAVRFDPRSASPHCPHPYPA